jgi:hypothetical protein
MAQRLDGRFNVLVYLLGSTSPVFYIGGGADCIVNKF